MDLIIYIYNHHNIVSRLHKQTLPVYYTTDSTSSNNDNLESMCISQSQDVSLVYIDSDDSSDGGGRSMSHPNKYQVQIENHGSNQYGYRKKPTR